MSEFIRKLAGMSALDLYYHLKGWQSLLGAIFGFVALMSGALFNFYLNRKRDAKLRREEVLAVTAALYGEIVLLRNEAADFARRVARVHVDVGTRRDPPEKFDQHFVESHKLPEPSIYKALISKIGLLPPNITMAVIDFYQKLQTAEAWIPFLVPDETRGFIYGATFVLRPAADAIRGVLPTLHEMEQALRLITRSEDLDLGCTDGIFEDEDDMSHGPD